MNELNSLPPEVLSRAIEKRSRALAPGEDLTVRVIPDLQAMSELERAAWYQEQGLELPQEAPHDTRASPAAPVQEARADAKPPRPQGRTRGPGPLPATGAEQSDRTLLILLIQGQVDPDALESYLEQWKPVQRAEVIYQKDM